MNRSSLTIMHLSEQSASKVTSRARVSGVDFAFLLAAAVFIVGGCFFMLELGAAQSSGHESAVFKLLAQACAWVPAMLALTGKYILLFVASIVNSALIVLLVQSLRSMDMKVSRLTPRLSLGLRGKKVKATGNVRRSPGYRTSETHTARSSSPFLLSPVFR